ncbi:Ras-related protein Rab-32A [Diplonema papillatum]|nr:Ras-related protein Rab-32A [Diplonema papillatum]|eukprot:gene1635-biopygen1619
MAGGAHDERCELLYKVLVVGDVNVGKTSFVKRYTHALWQTSYKSTIGVDFSLKEIYDVGLNTTIRVQLWDIAGQERYKNLTRVYYNKAVAAVVLYDASNEKSLEGAFEWKTDLDHKVFLPNDKPIPCILVANKVDLASSRTLSAEAGQKLAEDNRFVKYFEASAKTGKNVDESINWLVQHVYNTNPTAGGAQNADSAERNVLSTTRDAQSFPPPKKRCCM